MASITVVGAGAIGSHVLRHVARMPGVNIVKIVDRDRYEPANAAGQDICAADVGKPKAQVQAVRLAQINPSLTTQAFHGSVEDVPLGWLHGEVILACLDSRRARMVVNQAAWRLGVPWIDAGINASDLLARVEVFMPSDAGPCMECAWSEDDYALVEQAYPCQIDDARHETGAPSSLAALAASLQAIECEKLLSADRRDALVGRQLLICAAHHRHYVTTLRRNDACRMPDHSGGWPIRRSNIDPASTTLAQLMAMAGVFCGSPEDVRIGVAGSLFATALTCRSCGRNSNDTGVFRGERRRPSACPACGGAQSVGGIDLHDTLALDAFPASARDQSLAELGLQQGDVLTLATSEREMFLELIGDE
jgi:molybdopterin/thiamine biosynthesis adenylyltransferase